jgi:P22 coat protein - gene protein 5.
MAGHTSSNVEYLTRSNLWSAELKDVLYADLMNQKYCKMVDFPDGDTLNIPSIGQMEIRDFAEGRSVEYTSIDTGNFTMTIDQYKSAGTFITAKARQDLFYASQLEAAFLPKMSRALAEEMEAKVFALGPEGQTASAVNSINGAEHRWVGQGTNEVIAVQDFAKALYALQKANVPMSNLVAIVDPSVEYTLNTLSNIVNVSNNPRWEGIIETGHRTGMHFLKNIFGFDVYVSQFLKSGISETVDSVTVTTGVANLFFSAASDVLPFIGAVRQAPKVDSEWNKDFQREEYVVTCRYGYKLYRPENMVVVLTDTDQV